MANPHFANLGDVWKHLLLTEVISGLQPGHYVGLQEEVEVIYGDGLAQSHQLRDALPAAPRPSRQASARFNGVRPSVHDRSPTP